MKKLFIIGTPIGNFDDITIRALNVLNSVDIIACEDTRVTQKLLNHFNISNKKLISYHNFNEKQSSNRIIKMILEENKKIALVSDAGMPTIADPGFELIEEAKKNKIMFEIIPGVSSLTTAMAASGMGPHFTFLGFGKNKKSQQQTLIKNLEEGTYVFFVPPHKVENFLNLIIESKIDHKIFIARELTKIHETFYEGNAIELINEFNGIYKGEFTIVLKINKIKNEKINKYKKSTK